MKLTKLKSNHKIIDTQKYFLSFLWYKEREELSLLRVDTQTTSSTHARNANVHMVVQQTADIDGPTRRRTATNFQRTANETKSASFVEGTAVLTSV